MELETRRLIDLAMRKIIITLSACLLVSFISEAQELSQLFKDVRSSVVFIEIESFDYSQMTLDPESINSESLGSGVLVSNDGLIWTASHVVQAAELITVEFTDGDVYEAEVISSNPNADVALIKVKEGFQLKNKRVASIGDSDAINIGEDIFIVGAPHGLKQSLSKGIISGRFVPDNLSNDFETVEFLQTDAAINPGNSGGPMFNMKGEVVGISSRIYSKSGGFEGIGFAISSNVAEKLLSKEQNSWTGMESILLTKEMAYLLNVPQQAGLLVLSVSSKGLGSKIGLRGGVIPAQIAGKSILLGGDIILEIAGIKFEHKNSSYLIKRKMNTYSKGSKVPITILRGGEVIRFEFPKQ